MQRGQTSLAIVAATAAFVGLFGTVCGIIGSLRSIGGSRSQILSSITLNISEALLPTILGLFVAVLAVWSHRYIASCMAGFRLEMEAQSISLVNTLLLHVRRSGNVQPMHFVRTARPAYSASKAFAVDVTEEAIPANIGPLRQPRHGLWELLWPHLRSSVDAEALLDRGLSSSLLCAAINSFLYWRSPSKAVGMFLFLLASGLAIRAGSLFASAALPISVLVLAAMRFAFYEDFQAAATLWTVTAFVLTTGAFRAARSPYAIGRRQHTRPTRIAFSLLAVGLLPTTLPALFPIHFFYPPESSSLAVMEPTLHEDDQVIMLSQSFFGKPQAGEVVAYHAGRWGSLQVARIIGLPGDRIRVKDGIVERNGSIVDEPYLDGQHASSEGDFPLSSRSSASQYRSYLEEGNQFEPRQDGPYLVPPGCYFLLADNRSAFGDSRVYGPTSEAKVVSRVVFARSLSAPPWQPLRLIDERPIPEIEPVDTLPSAIRCVGVPKQDQLSLPGVPTRCYNHG